MTDKKSFRKPSIKPIKQQKIALERIRILFNRAGKEFRKHPERSKRYVKLAKIIGMRYNVRIPKEYRRKFCRECFSYLIPGVSSRSRVRRDKQAVIVTCLKCGGVSRYPYIKEKKNIKQ